MSLVRSLLPVLQQGVGIWWQPRLETRPGAPCTFRGRLQRPQSACSLQCVSWGGERRSQLLDGGSDHCLTHNGFPVVRLKPRRRIEKRRREERRDVQVEEGTVEKRQSVNQTSRAESRRELSGWHKHCNYTNGWHRRLAMLQRYCSCSAQLINGHLCLHSVSLHQPSKTDYERPLIMQLCWKSEICQASGKQPLFARARANSTHKSIGFVKRKRRK